MSERFEKALRQLSEYSRVAVNLQDIEGNRLDAYDPTLLEMFERRNMTPEECIDWLKRNAGE